MSATLTVTPVEPKTGDVIEITGEGFAASTTVELEVSEAGLIFFVKTSPSGTLKTDNSFRWSPAREGIFTLTANDGTNEVRQTIQVWTG